MNRRGSGVVAVLASLLVVGVVRASIPQYLPTESHVTADADGVVGLAVGDVEVLEVRAVRKLQSDGFTPRDIATDEVFVVVRVLITPHGGTLRVVSDLQTADGRTYEAFDVQGFPSPGVAYVGQRVTQTHIFEMPEERLGGAHLMIRGAVSDGVQGIQPVAWFPLDVDVESGILTTEEDVVEPAR